jgi:aconitate hydratase
VFKDGEGADELCLSGREQFTITGIAEGLRPGKTLQVVAKADDGKVTEFEVVCRIDTPNEVEYYRHGGILQYVLRNMLKTAATKQSAV